MTGNTNGNRQEPRLKLIDLILTSGTASERHASVTLGLDDKSLSQAHRGTGPVYLVAIDAIKKAIPHNSTVLLTSSITFGEGDAAITKSTVQVQFDERAFEGYGEDPDVAVAIVKGYVGALEGHLFAPKPEPKMPPVKDWELGDPGSNLSDRRPY